MGRRLMLLLLTALGPFDSVDHGCAIAARISCGPDAHLIHWVSSLLSNRAAEVSLQNTLSKPVKFTFVVLHGSVIGQLLSIKAANTLREGLLKIPNLEHALITADRTVARKAEDKNTIEHTLKLAVGYISKWGK
ncbi:putative retrotransposon hot spot protein [Trypanosoma grayi]|uniref:putative retrotransposon hot spot protein n=1 Tax=Trypanosoma grayi TaxID=71804 RepID=UPI0004F4624D|nr:putative retrotransposon hot spot protein [Trypanosoma grayi]KEG06582.1 putative retrotransposon hot spot protein [Trypanosoma grayi]